eukprot:m.227657 g.227657  ORF g.227657 m.227657 type:complete len:59 (+) comp17274_c0_seq1:1224-1400(+)
MIVAHKFLFFLKIPFSFSLMFLLCWLLLFEVGTASAGNCLLYWSGHLLLFPIDALCCC